jgi:hypothetical protein
LLVLVVDVENVRGKSGFAYSHQDLLEGLEQYALFWKATSNACDLGILGVVDHGSAPTGFSMHFGGLVFAGPTRKADDVVAQQAVPYFCSHEYTDSTNQQALVSHVVVVTDNQDLIRRCWHARRRHARALSRSAPSPALTFFSPRRLLKDLGAMHGQIMGALDAAADMPVDESVAASPLIHHDPQHQLLNYEIQVGAELLLFEALLRFKKHITHKRQEKLQQIANRTRERLVQLRSQSVSSQAANETGTGSLLNQIAGFLDSNRSSNRSSSLNFTALAGLSQDTQSLPRDQSPGHPVDCFVDWVNDQHRQQPEGNFMSIADSTTD